MAMVTAGEFDDQLATGKAPSKTDTRHCRFSSTIHHSYFLNRRHPATDQLGHFYLRRVRNTEAETLCGGSLNRLYNLFRSMTEDRWAPSSHVIDVFVPFDVPNV